MSSYAGTWPLLRLALRRDRWVIVASVLALVATAYGSMAATLDLYPTDADAATAARLLTDNTSVTAIYGPLAAPTREAIGVLKTVLLGCLGLAFLAVALVRRHTRTEEEEGRLELVAAGVVGRRAPLAAAVLLAGGSTVLVSLLGTLSLLSAGRGGAVALGVSWLVTGLVMTAVAAVAAQLTTTARGCGGIALGVLGVAFVLRAVGDTATGPARQIASASFLGWSERVAPYGADRLWLLLPGLALTAALLLLADGLLHRRDLGAGLWASRPGPATAARTLSTPIGLAWRLQRGALLAWTIVYAVLGLVVGGLAGSAEDMASSPGIQDMLRRMSGGQGSLTEIFLGTELRFLAVGAAAFGIGAALRLRSEEATNRAESVLATRVSRWSWLASHAAVAVLGAVCLMVVAGLSIGVSASRVSDVGPGDVGGAALATLPAVAVCVGVTLLLFGLRPRWSTLAWGLLGLFVLLGEFGALLGLPRWALGLSPFDHLGSLPGGAFDGGGMISLLVVAAAASAVGALAFRRRDLTT